MEIAGNDMDLGNSKRMRNEEEGSPAQSMIRKKTCIRHVKAADKKQILSPITEISRNLSGALIGTPNKWNAEKEFAPKINELSYVGTMDDMSFYDDAESHRELHQDEDLDVFPQVDDVLVEETTRNLKLFSYKPKSLDDFDCNSMDSGFNSNASLQRRSTSLFRSTSLESIDDDYLELMASEEIEEETQTLPSNLNSLITSSIKTDNTRESPVMRRPLCPRISNSMRARSLFFEAKTPEILKGNQIDKETPKSIKKPEVSRSLNLYKENVTIGLRKCMSMNDADIMSALSRPSIEEHIGDHSKPYVLPLINGRHNDLKSITCDTMAKLLQGEFDNKIASYKVIDCRYPYEYEGGHIKGAVNWYNQDMILDNLVNSPSSSYNDPDAGKGGEEQRFILVFHCEFSSERGPKMSRFLRNFDRNANEYPNLQFPEIYLLHNGYKEFFEHYPNLCDPSSYLTMLDPKHCDDLRQFRSKSKTWNGDAKCVSNTKRIKKSKSRLVL